MVKSPAPPALFRAPLSPSIDRSVVGNSSWTCPDFSWDQAPAEKLADQAGLDASRFGPEYR
jgi:hypothetical protein